ncbi:hypothetical protein GCM10007898_24350 [Dyella flagellata]|uniref:DUF3885 domain-containing protein n=2 Tax=Dyella flagellata TaxID=1867833 RepID=A0ABQ5XEK7_9GAMM|nr:hypothetical protein GCM10007898_24350 [Dyella flagellata]
MRFGEDGAWNESEADVALPKIMTHFMQAGDEDDEIHFFGTPLTWGEAKHDSLLRAVADDRTGRVMIFNPARRAAFAPYDGGADLFFPTEFDVSVARNKFGAWLSPHPDGL